MGKTTQGRQNSITNKLCLTATSAERPKRVACATEGDVLRPCVALISGEVRT